MSEKRKLFSSLWDLPYGKTTSHNLFDNAKNSKEFVQKLQLQRKIPVHDGCVNSICWNDTGSYLLSGSDDQRLSIVHGYDYSVLAYIQTGHKANIFSAKFLPNRNDKHVVSCSGDGIIIYSDVERAETSLQNKFECHTGTAYEIITVPNDPNTFLSCGEDRTVRWFDLRTKTSCNRLICKEDILIQGQSPVTSLAVNPYMPYQLAVGCADSSVRIYDRRMLCTQNGSGASSSNGAEALMSCFTVPDFTQNRRITSLCYSADGQEMLVSYSSDYIYLFDIKDDMNKKPRSLSVNGSSPEADSDAGSCFRGRPLMRRLRIRGDWSDTGPNARPEAEARAVEENPSVPARTTIVRTMSDILTRMFNNSSRGTESTDFPPSSGPSQASNEVADALDEVMNVENEAGSNTTETSPLLPSDVQSSTEPLANHSASLSDQLSEPGTSGICDCPCSSENQLVVGEETDEKHNLVEKKPDCRNMNNVEEPSEGSSACSISEDNELDGVERMDSEHYSMNDSIPHLVTGSLDQSNGRVPTEDLLSRASEISNDDEAPVISEIHSIQLISDVVIERPEQAGSSDDQNPGVEMLMDVESWDDEGDEEENRNRSSSSNFIETIHDEVRDAFCPGETHIATVSQPRIKRKYTGHRNARTMIKESTFWGDNFVMSGSDCGHIFIWDRHTTELVMLMEADHHVVNCLQPHPFDPILASSGIDYDIKLWTPTREEPLFDVQKANEIVKRNEIMLEETKDTITVPATFMFRMFSTLSHFRQGRAYRWSRVAREMRANRDAANSDTSER
ncbi:hypothetical protein JTE90_025479 [Oedothorax gibbosus]|uniref:Nuclear receptor interaction protein n=1 Tax=Oedothorax gibbosus TaxID=931172 RepID=A0AAV6UXC3_9ARAC|nr:hypothetical protein JTE90_025479 [Oedothorax gibbosus]